MLWQTHPAFWWDNDSDGVRESGEELSGIWVGKFETSHKTLSIDANNTTANNLGTCTLDSCANYTGLRILPNVRSLRYNSISRFFYASRHMEDDGNIYGLDASSVDSHMMKNSEWGAVVYLSHSTYGINEEVRLNNQNGYIVGCGGATATAGGNATCSNLYGTISTGVYPQSTTGNATGVFDMSGGAWDAVMGVLNATLSSSGFNTTTILLPDSKYYDNYPSSIFSGDATTNASLCTLEYCGGHALNETKAWYSDSNSFVNGNNSWFYRGGAYNSGNGTGIFGFIGGIGASTANFGFRLVLIEN